MKLYKGVAIFTTATAVSAFTPPCTSTCCSNTASKTQKAPFAKSSTPTSTSTSNSTPNSTPNSASYSRSTSITQTNQSAKDDESNEKEHSSRRLFMRKAATTSAASTGLTFGMLLNMDNDNNINFNNVNANPNANFNNNVNNNYDAIHADNCQCHSCAQTHASDCSCGGCSQRRRLNVQNHKKGCKCGPCVQSAYSSPAARHRFGFGPSPAMAAEMDDKNDKDPIARSPDYYAQMKQMKETNARLQASGYQLDTREQEQAKINDAFASFSYDAATTKSSGKKGKGTSTSTK